MSALALQHPFQFASSSQPGRPDCGKAIKGKAKVAGNAEAVRAHCFQNWREPYVSKGTRSASPTSLHSVSCASAVPAP